MKRFCHRLSNVVLWMFFVATMINKSTNMNPTYMRYKLLQGIHDKDTKVKLQTQSFVKAFLTISLKREYFKYQDIHLTGSIQEGGFAAKIFKQNKTIYNGINQELEIDFAVTLLVLSKQYQHFVHEIPHKIGFAKVYSSEIKSILSKHLSRQKWLAKPYEKLDEFSSKDGFIKPYFIKQFILNATSKEVYGSHNIKLMIAFMYDIPYHTIKLENLHENVTKSTLKTQIYIKIDNVLDTLFELDMACVLKVEWVPTVLQEWIKRPKNWPPQHLISEELKYSYLIAKPSKIQKSNHDTTERRFSFTSIELKLINLQSQSQCFIFFIFKAMFYKYLQPIDPENVSSFLVKNIMFWLSEHYSPESKYWKITDETSITRLLRKLFIKLSRAFQNKYSPYYFNPAINIISGIRASNFLRAISSSVQNYVPNPSGAIMELLCKWKNGFSSGIKCCNIVRNEGIIC